MRNSELENTIKELKAASKKKGQPIWLAIAKELDKPKRIRNGVNLSRINRQTSEGDIAAIPGKVLASGSLDHSITVAAFSFSDLAREKIRTIGGETKTLLQIVSEGTDLKKIKLIK